MSTTIESTDTNDRTFSAEEICWIREALLIGLTCYGQVEEVLNTKKVVESTGGAWPKYLDVRHPTGGPGVVSAFATALVTLD